MTADQARRRLSNAIWSHFNRWATREALVVSKRRKGREVSEYSEQHVEEYLKRLFRTRDERVRNQYGPVLAVGSAERRKRVEFALKALRAQWVSVAGSFNEWEPDQTPLQKGKGGIWRTTVLLSPGIHLYRFVVDGEWRSDPNAQESSPNEFGETNSVVVV
ncbi:MAG TPA: isoamylase early set domain-containing protein [Verrucomicrobiae bacterium]|nr:isoamylase early set domain-containing protein [Verrucomicrobiae bacterium]